MPFEFTELHVQKVCKECGGPVVDGSRTLLCRRCAGRLSIQAARAQHRAAGTCVRCGGPLEGSFKQCEACRRKRREYLRRGGEGA